MVAEVFAGLSAIKTAFDLAKGLKDIDDATRRNAAVIELQEKILAAREAQSTLLERISELEKKVASFETWESEKLRYELKDIWHGSLAYVIKEGVWPVDIRIEPCYMFVYNGDEHVQADFDPRVHADVS